MQQRIVNNIGLPYIALETDAGAPLAVMTIHRNVMADIVRELARDCFHNGNDCDRQALLAVIEELQSLLP